MTKKNTSLWIEDGTQKKLKALSKKWKKPIGDIIDGLVSFSEQSPETTLLEKCFLKNKTCPHCGEKL